MLVQCNYRQYLPQYFIDILNPKYAVIEIAKFGCQTNLFKIYLYLIFIQNIVRTMRKSEIGNCTNIKAFKL